MAVTSFVSSNSSASAARYLVKTTGASLNSAVVSIEPGYYLISNYSTTSMSTSAVAATVNFVTSAGTVTATTTDGDSGSSTNPFQVFVNLPNGATEVYTNNVTAVILIERVSASITTKSGTMTFFRTSQNVTFTSTTTCLIYGGGGGGGASKGWGYAGSGGGGGGGFVRAEVPAGTYALVVGAAGAGGYYDTNYQYFYDGSNGGTTTFAGYTCTGGYGGQKGGQDWNQKYGGGGGTPNGTSGGGNQNGYGTSGTQLSASFFPFWYPTPGAAGSPGGYYGGGGGGGCVGAGGNQGGAGADGGGGGGINGGSYASGGNGGGGGVLAMVWS